MTETSQEKDKDGDKDRTKQRQKQRQRQDKSETRRNKTKTKENQRQHEGVKGEGGDATQLTVYRPLEVLGLLELVGRFSGKGRGNENGPEK